MQQLNQIPDKFELHPYQNEAYCQILNALEAGRRTVLVMPTGSGKTIVARSVIRRWLNSGKRVLFLSHRCQLNSQLIGKVGQHSRLTVSTIQGFTPNPEFRFDLIVIDEAHHIGSASYKAAISAYPSAALLGLTATPVRPNGDGLGEWFDVMVQTTTAAKLTKYGYLAPIRAFGPEDVIETAGIGKSGGDFNVAKLAKVSAADKHCAHAVEEYRKWAQGKRGIVFCVNRAHAQKMTRFYQAAGFDALYMDGNTPETDRFRRLKAWAAGKYDMICNCDLFTEGSDLPDIEFVQILRATTSLPLYFQMIGRGMRPDKSMILLDHTSNFELLGLPDVHEGFNLTRGKENGRAIVYGANQRQKVRKESGEIVDGDILMVDAVANLVEIDRANIREKAIAMKKANPSLTVKAIAEAVGVPRPTVHGWLKAAGMGASKTSVKEKAIAMKKANPDLTGKAIAEAVGVPRPTVFGWLKAAGMVASKTSVKEKAIAMKKANPDLTVKAIAEAVGVPRPTVHGWLKAENL